MVLLRVGAVGVARLRVGRLHGELVGECGLVHLRLLRLHVRDEVAALEDRPAEARADGAEERLAAEEAVGLHAVEAERAVDVELREEHRLGDADGGDLRGEAALGGAHVGARAHRVERDGGEALRGDEPVAVRQLAEERVERAGHRAGEDRERVHVLLLGGEEVRDRGARLLHVVLRLVDGELVADAAVEAALEDVVRLALELEVRAGDAQALLRGAEGDVLAADLGGERDPGVLQRVLGGGEGGVRRLVGAARPAEEVDLPGGVEPARPVVAVRARAARGARARETVRARARVGAVHRHLGHERGRAPHERPARLHEAFLRHEEGEVVRDGRRDEVRERVVVELVPPGADQGVRDDGARILVRLCGAELARRRLVRRRVARVRRGRLRRRDLGLRVIRPHARQMRAADERGRQQQQARDQFLSYLHLVHSFSFTIHYHIITAGGTSSRGPVRYPRALSSRWRAARADM